MWSEGSKREGSQERKFRKSSSLAPTPRLAIVGDRVSFRALRITKRHSDARERGTSFVVGGFRGEAAGLYKLASSEPL